MKKITKSFLKKEGACTNGYEWYLKQGMTDTKKIMKKLFAEDHAEWANWTIARLLNRKQKIKYAIFAAEQVIEIYEKKYPEDKRPRQAIDAAKLVLKRNTKENRAAANAAANAAAYAAANAANATNAAAYAAANAANAAYAATYAANATNAAAYAAANAATNAAYAAAKKEMQQKIINYGLKLLEGK